MTASTEATLYLFNIYINIIIIIILRRIIIIGSYINIYFRIHWFFFLILTAILKLTALALLRITISYCRRSPPHSPDVYVHVDVHVPA